nr:hypothetical protein [uncultured Devosia sp.]
MTILRSGLILFVSMVVVAAAIGWGYVSLLGPTGDFVFYALQVLLFCAVALITSILLAALAWRGRRQPLSDGIAIITVLVLTAAGVMSIASANYEPKYPDNMPPILAILLGVSLYLACLVPAYLFCYLALCRTPLLSGLAPLPKNKGPAEAGP